MSGRIQVKPLVLGGFTLVLYLYGFSIVVAASVYNWQYAREHGPVDWLVWGEVAPTAKAFAWPYFAFRHTNPLEAVRAAPPLSQRQINEMQIRSAMRAVDASLQANYIIDSRPPGGGLTQEQVQRVMDYAIQSLRSADTTDEASLNTLYPEFGTRFKRDFCSAQRLLISGLRANSRMDLERSSELDRAWKDWYNANRNQIADSFNAALK